MAAEGVGSKWAIGLDSVGYMMSTQDQESPFEYRAFTQQAVPLSLPRIDTSPEPGEQTLGDLWVRSQHDWSEGQGQRVFDGQNSSRLMAKSLGGFDPFIYPGMLYPTITPDNSQMSGLTRGLVIGDLIYLIGNLGSIINRFDESLTKETETITLVHGWPYLYHHNLESDGNYIYWATTSSGIRRMDITDAFGAWSATDDAFNNLDACTVLLWGKGRLIACTATEVHVIDDPTDPDSGAAAHYTHLDPDWTWIDAEDMSQGIYLAGHSDAHSRLYLMSFDTTDAGAGLTIGIPREIWRAPAGEKILCIKGYAGTAFLIGTNKGVRNCTIADREGNVLVGPLIPVVEGTEVHDIGVWERYAFYYYGPTAGHLEGTGRIAKLDLSTFAYSAAHTAGSQRRDKQSGFMCLIPPWFRETQTPIVTVYDASLPNYWTIHPRYISSYTGYPALAAIQTGDITFGTAAEKELKHLEIELDPRTFAFKRGSDYIRGLPVTTIEDAATIMFRIAMEDWTGDPTVLAWQGNNVTSDYHWKVTLDASRQLVFQWLDDTDTIRTATSAALPSTWTENDIVWIMIEWGQWIDFSYIVEDGRWHLSPWPPNRTDLWTLLSHINMTAVYPFKGGTIGDAYVYVFYEKPSASDYNFLYSFQVWTAAWWVFPDQRVIAFNPVTYAPDAVGVTWNLSVNDIVSPQLNIYYNLDTKGWKLLTGQFYYPTTPHQLIYLPEGTSGKTVDFLISTASYAGLTPSGHGILDWRLLSEPIPTPRYFRYYVPLMLYDDLQTLDGHRISRRGYAWEALAALDTIYRAGTAVDFQKPSGYHEPTVTTKVRIENMEFKEFAPPKGAGGFGGICLLVLREVAT